MNAAPAQAGHNPPSPAFARDGERLVGRLAREVGEQAAVSWAHAGALLAHAHDTGFAPDLGEPETSADGMLRQLEHLAALHPALGALADPAALPLWTKSVNGGQVAAIAALWREHPVTDPADRPHGYLLGNTYQTLSAESRKHRALAQTPRYVTDLLIDLGMRPAWSTWPIEGVRMIDPSCGTGHILVETLLAAYQAAAGGPCATWSGDGAQVAIDCDAAVRIAVDTVHGVDLDPYAALLATYRLLTLTALLLDCTLAQVPADLSPHVAAADALLGQHPLLERGRYHCVLGNPPYVTPKTATMRDAVRAAYPRVCHMKYALSLPFHALMNDLLLPGGWCAQLTANSFMKREFGKKYIEQYLPGYDLEWVIDTSGAYIPGHGTPTVILVNRNQPPTSDTVRSVLGILGEPKAPGDASQGLVWGDIARKVRERLARDWACGAPAHATAATVAVPPAIGQPKPVQFGLFDLAEAA